MKGIYIQSSKDNIYFYNDDTGYIQLIEDPKEYEQDILWSENAIPSTKVVTASKLKEAMAKNISFYQLIIETSTKCNMRCKYCVYGEHYNNKRSHGRENMTFAVAKKAIDYYLVLVQQSRELNPLKKPAIAFYGGEPLTNYQLIKEVVEYIEQKYPSQKIDYQITTNGTLLSEEVQDFLYKHKFIIQVSLDGDKTNHDRNRVFENGLGTFDLIHSNIINFVSRYPDHKKIHISACCDYNTDLYAVHKFFRDLPVHLTSLSLVESRDTTYYSLFTEEVRDEYFSKLHFMSRLFESNLSTGQVEENLRGVLMPLVALPFHIFQHHSVSAKDEEGLIPYSGTCMPGDRIYVDVHGDFCICEKINSSFKIGDINHGLDTKQIAHIINRYNEELKKCSNCPISRVCSVCYAKLCKGEEMCLDDEFCHKEIANYTKLITRYINFMEQYPRAFRTFLGEIKGALKVTNNPLEEC